MRKKTSIACSAVALSIFLAASGISGRAISRENTNKTTVSADTIVTDTRPVTKIESGTISDNKTEKKERKDRKAVKEDPVKLAENAIFAEIPAIWNIKEGKLPDGVTFEKIGAVEQKVNALPDSSSQKAPLKLIVSAAKTALDVRNKEAIATGAVSKIWNIQHGEIPNDLTEAEVNGAQNAVNLLPDGNPTKAELQKMVNASRDALRARLTAKAEAEKKAREEAERKAREKAAAEAARKAAAEAAAREAAGAKASRVTAPNENYEYNHSCAAARAGYDKAVQLLNSGATGEQDLCVVPVSDADTECGHVVELISDDLCHLVTLDYQCSYRDNGDGTAIISANIDELRSIKAQKDATAATLQNLGRQVVTPGMSEKQAVHAIHDWICQKYTYDASTDATHCAASTLQTGRACCEAYATTFTEMARGAGLRAETVYGYSDGGYHAWNKVVVDGQWYYIDVTFDDSRSDLKYYLSPALWSNHSEFYPL